MAIHAPAPNEFSRRIRIDDLGDETTEEIEATGSERDALARRLGLQPVDEVLIDLDAEDPPEPVVDGGVDIGEVVTEHLALALDPYPRREGARMRVGDWAGSEGDSSPFAVLKSLKGSS